MNFAVRWIPFLALAGGSLLTVASISNVRISGIEGGDAATPARVGEAIRQGRYRDAVAIARRSLAITSQRQGDDSAGAREALRALVEALWRNERSGFAETLELAERSAAADERAVGPDDPATLASLRNLGRVLTDRDETDRAESVLRRTLTVRERMADVDPNGLAANLDDLARALEYATDSSIPRALFARAVAILDSTHAPDPLVLASALVRYGHFERTQSALLKARALGTRGQAILEREVGPDHPAVAECLRDSGVIHQALAEYDDALKDFQRAVSILEARVPEQPLTAFTHMNMANMLMMEIGDYTAAREHYARMLAVFEKTPIPDTWLGAALQNYATLLARTGDYAAARPLYERALVLRARDTDPTSIAYAQGVVARFLVATGDWARAESMIASSIATLETYAKSDHEGLAFSRVASAKLFQATGRPRQAKESAEKAVRLIETAFGREHPLLVEPLDILGTIALDAGDRDAARRLFERALSIQNRTRGAGHPLTAATMISLARFEWRSREYGAGFSRALAAENVARAHLRRSARVLSQREALRYEAIRGSSLDLALTVLAGGRLPKDAAGRAWDEVVRSRALVLDEMAERHRSMLDVRDDRTGPLLDALTTARELLAHLVVAGPPAKKPQGYRSQLEQAVAALDRCERALGAESEAFRHEQEQAGATLSDVVAALPQDAALVAYVQYKSASAVSTSPPLPSYLALVVTREARTPVAVPLGSARDIDALVSRWRAEVSTIPLDADALDRYRRAGAALRRAIWDPLARYVSRARSVYVVPDGELNLVAFHTLPADAEARYLVESDQRLQYLSAERDLVAPKSSRRLDGGLLAFGGPDFDADPDSGERTASENIRPRSSTSTCAQLASMTFSAIPSSRDEVDEVRDLWARSGRGGFVELTGRSALEGRFKRDAPGRSVVHVATHSFSLGGVCAADGEDPLLFSGLAFAGANRRSDPAIRVNGEDGILTAEEVASLDLRGVSWVVLSSCDSGVGPVQTGEGILGLRRAFEVAGADTLISSLWAVTDHDTRTWMRSLYEGRLAGQTTADAVRAASLRMLESRRRAGATTHPFFWGAFVAVGDPS